MQDVIPETPITDIDVARVGANVEKPFRDALVKYKGELTAESKRALEIIAGKEGEEAMAVYQQTRSLEDPKIAGLRALVNETIILSYENRLAITKKDQAMVTEKGVENLLKQLGQGVLDSVIADEITDLDVKKARLDGLGTAMNQGVKIAIEDYRTTPAQIVNIYSSKSESGGWNKDCIADMMRGYFAVTLLTGEAPKSITALAEIGKLEDRDPVEVIQEHLPLILELRKQNPVVNKWTGALIDGKREMALDEGMKSHDFRWNSSRETYVHTPDKVAPFPAPK